MFFVYCLVIAKYIDESPERFFAFVNAVAVLRRETIREALTRSGTRPTPTFAVLTRDVCHHISKFYKRNVTEDRIIALMETRSHKGWTHKDVMKLSTFGRMKPKGGGHRTTRLPAWKAFQEYTFNELSGLAEAEEAFEEVSENTSNIIRIIRDFHKLKHPETSRAVVAELMDNYPFVSRRIIPSHRWLEPEIFPRLVQTTPSLDLLQWLPLLVKRGLLTSDSAERQILDERLANTSAFVDSTVKAARVWIDLKKLEKVTRGADGDYSSLIAAVEKVFYASLKNIKPSMRTFRVFVEVNNELFKPNKDKQCLASTVAVLLANVFRFSADVPTVLVPKWDSNASMDDCLEDDVTNKLKIVSLGSKMFLNATKDDSVEEIVRKLKKFKTSGSSLKPASVLTNDDSDLNSSKNVYLFLLGKCASEAVSEKQILQMECLLKDSEAKCVLCFTEANRDLKIQMKPWTSKLYVVNGFDEHVPDLIHAFARDDF